RLARRAPPRPARSAASALRAPVDRLHLRHATTIGRGCHTVRVPSLSMREEAGPPSAAHRKAEEKLRQFALAYPEAVEEFPWGERAVKVRKKVFLFMTANDTGLHLSTKLPESAPFALSHPFALPTGYGLGKSGWVSA